MRKLLIMIAAVAALSTLCLSVPAQQTAPSDVKTVAKVDLARYAGKWYEIGRYPNRFQKKCVGNTSAAYTLKPNGRVEVRNECLLKDGKIDVAVGDAKVVDPATNAKLKVRFAPSALAWLPFVWGDYWIIDLDKDYKHVAIGDPKRQYFWVLSRDAKLDDKSYQDILRRAEAMGFDPAKVIKTPQNVDVVKGTVMVKQ